MFHSEVTLWLAIGQKNEWEFARGMAGCGTGEEAFQGKGALQQRCGGGEEHGVFPKPLRGAWVCPVLGALSSLEVGKFDEMGLTCSPDQFVLSPVVLGDSSNVYNWAMKGSDLYFHKLYRGGRHRGQQINECSGEGCN